MYTETSTVCAQECSLLLFCTYTRARVHAHTIYVYGVRVYQHAVTPNCKKPSQFLKKLNNLEELTLRARAHACVYAWHVRKQ